MRDFDIIVFGATGYTGKLVVTYLAQNHPTVKIAIAGRDKKKLDQVNKCLPTQFPTIIADSNNQQSLDVAVSQAKVVLTTVGPFIRYGAALVDSCVRMKTDYIDSTGEAHFIKKIIDKYHDAASKNNVRIVTCCGFDSIPSDLGVLSVAQYLSESGRVLKSAQLVVTRIKAGISSGTIHSVLDMMELPFETLFQMRNPYYLVPSNTAIQLPKSQTLFFGYEKVLKRWTNFYIMEAINTRIVLRSWWLLNRSYGSNFTYNEGVGIHKNPVSAFLSMLTLILAMPLLLIAPIRWAFRRIFKVGQGPDISSLSQGGFTGKVIGYSEDDEIAIGNVEIKGDPGYLETAKMLAESALCLSLDTELLKSDKVGAFGVLKGGILTPASSMGMVLVDRLDHAGIKFTVQSAS